MSKKEIKVKSNSSSKKMNKDDNKLKIKNNNKKINFKKIKKTNIILIKLFLILFLIFGFWFIINNTYSNKVSLLAVSETSQGDIVSGSIIDLNLEIKPGTGEVYVQLNSLEEIDTQISIINSQKIACNLFDLDCENYDFYYSFDGSSLILKGPSASSAIAILTAKTMNKEKIDDSVVITGSLNSGGLIGNVGGIDEKIQLAQEKGFSKVLIPVFSSYNETTASNLEGIEVIKVMDIVDAYNFYSGEKYEFKGKPYDKTKYSLMMKNLSDKLCERSIELKSEVNLSSIDNSSSLNPFKIQAEKSYNSSRIALENSNYYAMGSFCYNSNINYRIISETQKNLSSQNIDENILELRKELDRNYQELNSNDFKSTLSTRNDLYAYLIIMNRIEEAREFISHKNIKLNSQLESEQEKDESNINESIINNSIIINSNSNSSEDFENITIDINVINISNSNTNASINQNSSKDYDEMVSQNLIQNIRSYSYSQERYYTVELWKSFINHQGEKIKIDDMKINEACIKINNEIYIKNELLKNYGLNIFDSLIEEQKQTSAFGNKYICVYNGLELNGKIDTILNSFGISQENQKNYTIEILDIVDSRLGFNSNGDFPLISHIYAEYAHALVNHDDVSSSMLYSNYALSYANIDLYLDKEIDKKSYFNSLFYQFFKLDLMSILFIFGIMFIIAFL